jgi:hypothetical protein
MDRRMRLQGDQEGGWEKKVQRFNIPAKICEFLVDTLKRHDR